MVYLRHVVLVVFCLLPMTARPPLDRVGLRGSFVIAAICEDGIVVVSDSRANIFDKTDPKKTPLAYYDGIQKIFPIGQAAVAETGQGLISGMFFSALFDNFAEEHQRAGEDSLERLLPSFIEWTKSSLPPEAFKELTTQQLVAAGFIGGLPSICYFNRDQLGSPFACIQGSGFVESDRTGFSAHVNELAKLPSVRVAALAREAIREYARQGDRWKTIGGPISVLLVTQSACQWLENKPSPQRWKNVRDLIKDYKAGVFRDLYVISPATTKTLEALFGTVP